MKRTIIFFEKKDNIDKHSEVFIYKFRATSQDGIVYGFDTVFSEKSKRFSVLRSIAKEWKNMQKLFRENGID